MKVGDPDVNLGFYQKKREDVADGDPDKYVKSLDEGQTQISVEGLKNDLQEHRKEEQTLKIEIPESIIVSIFQVNCKEIRNFNVGKHYTFIEKEIKLIAFKAKEINYTLITKRPRKNIEELTDTKMFIQEISGTIEKKLFKNNQKNCRSIIILGRIKILLSLIFENKKVSEKLKNDIKSCMEVYDILDELNFEFSGSDLDNKWYLFGAPRIVVEIIETKSQVLEKQKVQFAKYMETEQKGFEDILNNLATTGKGFHAFDELYKYEEIAINVESVNQRLTEWIEHSRLYNQREFFVGKEQKDQTFN